MKHPTTFLLLIGIALHSVAVNAQLPQLKWVDHTDGNNPMNHVVVVDDACNVIVGGTYQGDVIMDPGPGALFGDVAGNVFLHKLDPLGGSLWFASFESDGIVQPSSVDVDPEGNVYALFPFFDSADFDPGPGVAMLYDGCPGCGNTDVAILKLDADGQFQWVKKIGGPGFDWPGRLSVDPSGSAVYLCGSTQDTLDLDPGPGVSLVQPPLYAGETWIMKLNLDGNFIWGRQATFSQPYSGGSAPSDIESSAGTVYLLGTFGAPTDFDPGPGVDVLAAASWLDPFLSRFDTDGNYLGVGSFGNMDGICPGNDLEVDGAGNAVICGSFTGTVDVDMGPGVSELISTPDTYDGYLIKYNELGELVWGRNFEGSGSIGISSLTIDGQDGICFTGSVFGSSDLDPGTGDHTITSTGESDGYVARLNSSGTFDWAMQYESAPGDYNEGKALDCNRAGGLWVAGYMNGPMDIDPTAGQFLLLPQMANIYLGDTTNTYLLKLGISRVFAEPGSICPGGTAQLTAATWGNGEYTFHWSTADSDTTAGPIAVSPDSTTTYTLIVSQGSCDTDTINVVVTVLPAPFVDLGPDAVLCMGDSIELDADPQSGTYLWSDGATTQTTTITAVNEVWVIVDNGLCAASDTVQVIAPEDPGPLTFSVNGCAGVPSRLTIPQENMTYLWADGDTTRIMQVDELGTYAYQITDTSGCSYEGLALLVLDPLGADVLVPNVFSPNNDGTNDRFEPLANGSAEVEVTIFNRWGQEVFHSASLTSLWDGRIASAEAPPGTYFYVVAYQPACELGLKTLKGQITLLR